MSASVVLFCAHDRPNAVGGPYAWLAWLLPALRDQGIPVAAALTHHGPIDDCPLVQSLVDAGVPIRCRPRSLDSANPTAWFLEQAADVQARIVVPNLVVAAYLAGPRFREAGISTVGILHSDDPFYHGISERFVFGSRRHRVTAVVPVSRCLEEHVVRRASPGLTIRRIPYGVGMPALRARPPERLRLVYAGRLVEEQKQISAVTRALCRAARDVSGVEAVLLGEGPARPAVERILEQEGEGLPVRCLGRIEPERIQDRFLDSDVVVLLSDYEGLPIALMEAMACGCVPVCLRIRSGIPELVEHEATGLLVEDRGAAFVAAVRRLRDDHTLRNRLSRQARQRIELEYTRDIALERWTALLRDLSAETQSPRPLRITPPWPLAPTHPGFAHEDIRTPPAIVRMLRRASRSLGFRGSTRSDPGSQTR